MKLAAWIALVCAGLVSFALDQGLLERPIAPDMTAISMQLGPFTRTNAIDVEPSLLGDYPPDRFLYTEVADAAGNPGLLYATWFKRGGRWSGRPHGTEVCFLAEGWIQGEVWRRDDVACRPLWFRRFERDGEEILVTHWYERPGTRDAKGWWQRLLRRLRGGTSVSLRQDVASIYWQFPREACPSEADLVAASEALSAELRRLWGE